MTGAVVRQSGAAGDNTNNQNDQYATQKVVAGQAGSSMAMPEKESQLLE